MVAVQYPDMQSTITTLFRYPVAGMQGESTTQLTLTPQGILGNRVFCVVPMAQIEQYAQNPELGFPLRATQVDAPQLALFTAQEKDDLLQLQWKKDTFLTKESLHLEKVGNQKIVPIRVSRTSKTPRWGYDCGDEVAHWISKRLGKAVRLYKAVLNDSPKHHFTWYSQVHLIHQSSLEALGNEVGMTLEAQPFRANIVTTGAEAFAESTWNKVSIAGKTFACQPCERCAYISIDQEKGALTKPEILKTVVLNHEINFGVYLETKEPVTLRIGDVLSPLT